MNNSPTVSPFPALPRHLNPYVLDQPSFGRRFLSKHVPSPLRQSFGPEDLAKERRRSPTCFIEDDSDEDDARTAVDECSSIYCKGPSTSTHASADGRIPKAPPGLESSNARNSSRYRFSDEIQQTIDSFRTCASYALNCARREKLIKPVKKLALEHTGLCLDVLRVYVERLESQLQQARNLNELNTVAAYKEALENEIRVLGSQREQIADLPAPQQVHEMRKSS